MSQIQDNYIKRVKLPKSQF